MFKELLDKLDALDSQAKSIQAIYEDNYEFYHPSESSLIQNTLDNFFNQANNYRVQIQAWLDREEGNDLGNPALIALGFAAVAGLAYTVYKAAPLIQQKLDQEKQKLDQAMEIAKLGPERAALYQANLKASPDLTISDMLSQIKPAITPGFSWGIVAAIGFGAWLYFRGRR